MEDQLVLDETPRVTRSEAMASDLEKFTESRLQTIKAKYIQAGEEFIGLGYGGSESITIFIRSREGKKIVRKILNEQFITAKWPQNGRGVMLPPVRKALSQARYLIDLPESAKDLFPRVLSHRLPQTVNSESLQGEYQYDMTYVKGIEVSKFVREYEPSPRVVAMLYAEIFRVLKEKIHAHRRTPTTGDTLEESYFKKIERRLALCQQTSPKLFSDRLLKADCVELNGKRLLNWHRVIQKVRENPEYQKILEPSYHCLVVGDTNTENIKIENIQPLLNIDESMPFTWRQFKAEDIGLKFLDPRAIGFHVGDRDTGADDYMYDNKPWHNSLGNYDNIHGEHFDLDYRFSNETPVINISIHQDSPYRYSYTGIDKYFGIVMSSVYEYFDQFGKSCMEDPNWLVRFVFVMGTHFMAMPPFHFTRNESGEYADDAQSQKRTVAIYAEGLRWLNCAVDLLEGKRKSFLGVYNEREAGF